MLPIVSLAWRVLKVYNHSAQAGRGRRQCWGCRAGSTKSTKTSMGRGIPWCGVLARADPTLRPYLVCSFDPPEGQQHYRQARCCLPHQSTGTPENDRGAAGLHPLSLVRATKVRCPAAERLGVRWKRPLGQAANQKLIALIAAVSRGASYRDS